MPRILVACMGNAIRGDDGFGPTVARRLEAARLADEVEVAEYGIAGIELVQRLMSGYDGAILVDAIDHGKPPGTIVELDPEVPDVTGLPWDELQQILGDAHETKPARVLLLARSLGCLPSRVRIVGCQAEIAGAGTELSPAVAAAVDLAVRRIGAIIRVWQEPDQSPTAAEARPQ